MSQAVGATSTSGRARAGLLLVGAMVVVAVAVAVWWPGATGGSDEAVEEFMHVHGLAVPAWDAEAVYVSTHEGLIRIDSDEQWHWVGDERHDFMGFTAHPSQPDTLYSSGHPGPGSGLANPIGFMVSTDGGESWQPRGLAGHADFHAMVAGGAGETVYGWNVAGEPGLYRSHDGGHSWEQPAAVALLELGGALALAVAPDDGATLWAGTQAGLVRSDDAGESWEPVWAAGPVTAVASDPADAERVLAYVATPEQGLVETRDGGASWEPLGLTLDGDAVLHAAIHPEDPRRVYVGTAGEDLLRSRDGGQTWQPLARAGRPLEDRSR